MHTTIAGSPAGTEAGSSISASSPAGGTPSTLAGAEPSSTPPGDSLPAPALVSAPDGETALVRQLANRTLWKALGCGLIADGFAWQYGVGLNLSVYLIAVLLASASLLRLRFGAVPRVSARLLILSAVFALLLAFRDSPELALLNGVAALSALGLAIAFTVPMPFSLMSLRVRDFFSLLARALGASAIGAPVFVARLLPNVATLRGGTAVSILRAGLLTIAVTLGFSALLAAGDPVFRQATKWIVEWNGETLIVHITCIALFTWPLIGL